MLKPAGDAKLPRVSTLLLTRWVALPSVVPPAALPLNVAAVITPPEPSLIAPAEFSVVCAPLTAPLIARLPAVVASMVLDPPATGPSTVNAWALVRAKPAAVKLPSVPIWLDPFSVVAPPDWP